MPSPRPNQPKAEPRTIEDVDARLNACRAARRAAINAGHLDEYDRITLELDTLLTIRLDLMTPKENAA